MHPTTTQSFSDIEARIEKRARLERRSPSNGIYAIGDVHGCLDLQKKMERQILADSADASGDTLILYLGDLVDRGPDSKGVIDHCLSPLPAGYERMSLCGNHDQLFFDFLMAPSFDAHWLTFGGAETLMSYGVDVDLLMARSVTDEALKAVLAEAIPSTHVQYLQDMAVALTTPEAHFVHAGMRVGVPMADQDDTDLMWIRDEFLVDEPASDRLIVHGHTPAAAPRLGPGRIGIDTKAVGGGPLTALYLRGGKYRFLTVSPDNAHPE